MPIKKGGIVTGKASKGANNTRNAAQRKANANARKVAEQSRKRRAEKMAAAASRLNARGTNPNAMHEKFARMLNREAGY